MKSMNQTANPDYIRISAGDNRVYTEIKELAKYKDLILLFVKRDFMVKYKQTILGPLWIVLQPFITSLMYLFVFGGIAKIDTAGVPGILFYTASNAMWGFFSSSLTSSAETFTANANLFGKVYFPRLTIPIANTISSALRFFIEMILFLILYVFFGFNAALGGSLLAIPVILLLLLYLGAFGIGSGIIISSMTVKYRDLRVLIGFGMQLWMYATPVVYPLKEITNPILRTLVLINPVSAPMELFRKLLFGSGTVVPWSCLTSLIITTIMLFSGIRLFSRVEKTFIDTV